MVWHRVRANERQAIYVRPRVRQHLCLSSIQRPERQMSPRWPASRMAVSSGGASCTRPPPGNPVGCLLLRPLRPTEVAHVAGLARHATVCLVIWNSGMTCVISAVIEKSIDDGRIIPTICSRRPVPLALLFAELNQPGIHGDGLRIVLPCHPPEVNDGGRQRALTGDEPSALSPYPDIQLE